MRKINIDLDKYMVYEDAEGDLYAALDIEHQAEMDEYYRKYDHFKTAPDEITMGGYDIIPDKEPESFTISNQNQREFKVNKLRGTWIRTGR